MCNLIAYARVLRSVLEMFKRMGIAELQGAKIIGTNKTNANIEMLDEIRRLGGERGRNE
jgi:hypothetical protein